MSEVNSIYYDVKFTTKEALEKEDFICPTCRILDSLHVTDSILKDSTRYHGVKYECSHCFEAYIAIDPSCLPVEVNDEISNFLVVRAEYDEHDFETAFFSE